LWQKSRKDASRTTSQPSSQGKILLT